MEDFQINISFLVDEIYVNIYNANILCILCFYTMYSLFYRVNMNCVRERTVLVAQSYPTLSDPVD